MLRCRTDFSGGADGGIARDAAHGSAEFLELFFIAYVDGHFHESRKDYGRALEVYERLLDKKPDETAACYQIGRVAAASGERIDRGVECLKLYLDRIPGPDEPSLAAAHYRLGVLYEKKGEKDLARREYAAASDLDPTLHEARQALLRAR